MSSLATARESAASQPARATVRTRARRLRLSADLALGLTLAAGLALMTFLTTGGVDLAPNTWVEIALVIVGAGLGAAALLLGAAGPAWGALPLLLFAAVAVLSFASIAWSVQPADSWIEANRTLSYLAAFAGALALARLAPGRWPAVVGAIAVLATVISGYALLVKVFPATFDPSDVIGRVRAPFDYWNASGLIAALGLPACLWAGARRERARALRALTVPAVAILVTVLMLSYSRGALLVAVIGLGCWFAFVPLRLRAALVLGLGASGGALITAWALATHAITHDGASLPSRTSAGHAFGLVLILTLGSLTIAGFAAAFAMDRFAPTERVRRRAGIVLVTLVALIPVGGLVAVAASTRGLTGEVSRVWSKLTNPNSGVGNSAGRLVELGNTRPRYWREGLKVGEHALLAGVGAAGYGTARTRYTSAYRAEHAHSYIIETFADFGLIGLAVNLALLLAWSVAARRAVGNARRQPGGPGPPVTAATVDHGEHTAERAGLMTLLIIVVIFGLHSTIDWTWFVPGTALPALLCAGWLAGRGPLSNPVGRARTSRPLGARLGAGAAVLALATIAILGAWGVWQPLRSADADAAALTALGHGNANAALVQARAATAYDPVAIDPLRYLSAIYTNLGDRGAAHHELVRAVQLQPQNPATWLALGEYELQAHQAQAALAHLETAHRLDLGSAETKSAIAKAQTELHAPAASGIQTTTR